MAIDLIGDVVRDLRQITKKPEFTRVVAEGAAKIHSDKMLELTKEAKAPSGRGYVALSDSHKRAKKSIGRKEIPDLRYGKRGGKTMDTLYITGNGMDAKVKFKKDEGLKEKNRYMYDHQNGLRGMPQRKIWPEEGDMKVGTSKGIVGLVGNLLKEYLMQPRTIKGTSNG